MSDDPKAREAVPPTPRDAPTDYPPAGIAVSTGTAWGTSLDPATLLTVAMLNPAEISERLDAIEARLSTLETEGVTPPPAEDERSQTRADLAAAARANQDLADEIFAKQRAEAERVQNIMNPRPPDEIFAKQQDKK
jgi:hypothetical protein